MTKKEIIKGIKDLGLYDFMARNYYQLSKDELKTIALECVYLLKDSDTKEIIKELKERL
jgi:hypothetical protein